MRLRDLRTFLLDKDITTALDEMETNVILSAADFDNDRRLDYPEFRRLVSINFGVCLGGFRRHFELVFVVLI